jgi:hypothetical protein
MLVRFHRNSGLPERMVTAGGGAGDSVGERRPVQWEAGSAKLERIPGPVEVVVLCPPVERSFACTRLLVSCRLDFVESLWGVLQASLGRDNPSHPLPFQFGIHRSPHEVESRGPVVQSKGR